VHDSTRWSQRLTVTGMMADGGNTIRGIDVLRHHHDLLGAVASPPTGAAVSGSLPGLVHDGGGHARSRVEDLAIVDRGGRGGDPRFTDD